MDTLKDDINIENSNNNNNNENGKINDGEVVNLLKESLNKFIDDDEKENEKDIQKNLAEDENEDLQLKNASLDKRTEIVVSIINNFYNVIHLLIAFFLAHFFGTNGWHVSWVILLILVMLRLHNLYNTELYKQKYLRYQQKMSKKNVKIGPMKEEKTEWLNDFLKCYYPNIVNSHMVMEMARSWLHDFVGGQMELYKPPMVKSAEVSSFEFGDTPPEINYIRAYRKENPNEYEMDIDILYKGELKVDIKIFSKLGTVPVSIHDFKINCQMKIEIGFWDKFPYLRYMRLAFRHLRKDWISFDIKALVEIFNIDFIRNWINSAIDYGIKCSMHLPHKLEIRWDTNTEQDFIDLKEGEFDHNGKYTTAVTLNIVQAKNLKVHDSNIPIDAYCRVAAGKFFVNTKTVKNFHPSWREQLIIPIDNRIPIEDQALEISIWDKGKKDTQHGSLKIPIKKLSPNSSVQGWFRINGFSHLAELHCILEYDINYTHNN